MAWRKPQDLDDYPSCVRLSKIGSSELLAIYCVECEAWKVAQISARAIIYISQTGSQVDREISEYSFVCQSCKADIEYLLSLNDKEYIKRKCRIQ